MIIKINGIIIKEYIIGESDKYITLFTKELGKIQVGAPRAKQYNNGLASGTQLFVYGEFLVSGHKGIYKLISVEPVYMFHNLRFDLITLSYATYIAEFISEVSRENSSNDQLLSLTLHALHKLTKPDPNAKLIRYIFEMCALALLGFMPQLHECVECGDLTKEQDKTTYHFSVDAGGIVCETCAKQMHSIKISYATWYTLAYIVNTPIKEVFRFNVESYVLKQLGQIATAYTGYYIEKSFKTLEFIKGIENL